MTGEQRRVTQCQKPSGWVGRWVLRNMNSRHSKVTDWGLSHVSIGSSDIVLDVGCGGGRTINILAGLASDGKVFGIDYSPESVAVSIKTNHEWIQTERVKIQEASVSHLPFPDAMFDKVTAVETHFWWPDLSNDLREILRVLKVGGMLVIIAEVYKGAPTRTARLLDKYAPRSGMTLLTIDEHRSLMESASYSDVRVTTEPQKGWICCTGTKAVERR